jgi:hypothetical protein
MKGRHDMLMCHYVTLFCELSDYQLNICIICERGNEADDNSSCQTHHAQTKYQ